MRKFLVVGCLLLLVMSTVQVSSAEAGRSAIRRVSRSINQAQRSIRQTSRVYNRVYRAPIRRAPVYRGPAYRAPAYYGPSHRSYYRAPVYRSGIYFGSPQWNLPELLTVVLDEVGRPTRQGLDQLLM